MNEWMDEWMNKNKLNSNGERIDELNHSSAVKWIDRLTTGFESSPAGTVLGNVVSLRSLEKSSTVRSLV